MPCLNSQKKGKGLGHASVSFLKKLGSWFQPWKVCSSLGIIIPVRARAVEMHINMSQEPLSAEIYRKNEARRNIEALEHWFKATSVWRNIDPRCSKNQVLYISGPWMAMLNHPWGKKIGQKMEKRERKIDEVSVSFSVFLLNLKQKLHNMSGTVCMWVCWHLSSHCFSGLIWQGYMSSWAPGSRQSVEARISSAFRSQTTVDHTLPMSICSIPIWRYRRAAHKKKKWKRQRYNNSTEYKQRQRTMRQNQRNLNNNTHSNAKNNLEVMFVSVQPRTVPSSRDVEISEA